MGRAQDPKIWGENRRGRGPSGSAVVAPTPSEPIGVMVEKPPNRIRELRDAQHLSVRDLAERSGVDSATINRMERGNQPLDYPRGKRIAAALGLKFSGILNDEDVELRASEEGSAVLAELAAVPANAWPEMIAMTRRMTALVRETAAQHSAGALGGTPQQVSKLADIWRGFDETGRDRALSMLALVGGQNAPR